MVCQFGVSGKPVADDEVRSRYDSMICENLNDIENSNHHKYYMHKI